LGARQWLPCKQFLPDKIDSAWIFITVPKNRKAGSNGVLTGITPIGDHKLRYEWKSRYPIAYYLLSFAVADYQEYSFYAKINSTDSVFVQNFIYNRPDYLALNKDQIDETAALLRFYSSVFGTYPFIKEKYGHCVAPIGGGMEHQTMTTLVNFDFLMVAHELAHQWFGDMATCSTWQDIWINEGFASYAEYLALDGLQSHEKALTWIDDAHRSALQDASGSVFVPASDADNEMRIFNYQLSYKKGASIIHMLRYELNNDSLFFRILRNYLAEFKNSVASMHDFQKTVNQLSNKNYSWFFDQWYFGKGYPVYDFSWKQQLDTVILQSHQTPSNAGSPFFKMSFDVRLEFAQGDTTFRVFQDSGTNVFKFRLKKEVQQLEIDPSNNGLKKIVNVSNVADLPSSDDGMLLSPNPIASELTLRFKTEPLKDRIVRIANLKGKTLIEQKIKRKKEAVINTDELSQGVYLVYVSEGNKQYIRKIIKLR
jgi:aminopeptidase N